jgi:MFS family permease
MAWGTIAWSFAELWVGRATSYGMLFASRSALGVGEASFGPASYSLVNDYYPVEDRGRSLGVLQVAPLVGLGTIFLGGAIAEAWGWRAAMYAYAFPGFVLAALALRLPEPRRGAMDRRAEGLERAGDTAPSRYVAMKTAAAYRFMLRIRTISTTLVGTGLAFFFITGIGIWLPTFMVRYHGMSLTTAAGTVTGVALLSGGAGTYLGGVVADRLLKRGWRTSRIQVAAVTMVASAVFFVPAAVVANTAVAVVTLAIGVVLAAAPMAPLLAARADVCHPDLRGRLAALQTLVLAVSSALSPALLGWLSDAYTLRFAFVVLAPMMAVGGAVLWVFSPRHVVADEERMRAELRVEATQ